MDYNSRRPDQVPLLLAKDRFLSFLQAPPHQNRKFEDSKQNLSCFFSSVICLYFEKQNKILDIQKSSWASASNSTYLNRSVQDVNTSIHSAQKVLVFSDTDCPNRIYCQTINVAIASDWIKRLKMSKELSDA